MKKDKNTIKLQKELKHDRFNESETREKDF